MRKEVIEKKREKWTSS